MRKLVVMLAGIGLIGGAGLACAHDERAEERPPETGTGGAGQRPPAMQEETEEDEIFGRSYEEEQGEGTGGAGREGEQKPQKEHQEHQEHQEERMQK